MPSYEKSSDSVFTLSESIRKEILHQAQSHLPEFMVTIPLQNGNMTAWCFQGNSALERANSAHEAASNSIEFLSDVKTIAPDLFAFVG